MSKPEQKHNSDKMPVETTSSNSIKPNVIGCLKSKFYIGQQFLRNPDSDNGLILLTVSNIANSKIELGSFGWKSKRWLSSNLFNPVLSFKNRR